MNKILSLIKSFFILGVFFFLSSCDGNYPDEIENNHEDEQVSDEKEQTLSETEIKEIIDKSISYQFTYSNKDCVYLFNCKVQSNIYNKLNGLSVKYGIEYGLIEPNLWYLDFEEWNGISSQIAINIVLPTEESLARYKEYPLYYGSYRTYKNKIASGGTLSKAERDQYNHVLEKLQRTETYMRTRFRARTYVSVNGVRYYNSTIKIADSSPDVKIVPSYTDEKRTVTEECDWCGGDGICSNCSAGMCIHCGGIGYSYTYMPLWNKEIKEDCIFCNGGKCDSCHGSMTCSKCHGKGSLTKTVGGIATIQGKAVKTETTIENSQTAPANSIAYDKVIDTYWQSESYITFNENGEIKGSGEYSPENIVRFGFSDTLCEFLKFPTLYQIYYQQTGTPPPTGFTVPNIFECYLGIGSTMGIFPIQIKEGYLSFNLSGESLIIESIKDDELILRIKTYDSTGILEGLIIMKPMTKESFFGNIKTYRILA